MARIRTVKPEHWSDKELPKISLQAHLLWIATWNFSDDEGVFEADIDLLKSQIFPRRKDVRLEQMKQWLDQLVKARFILPFQFKNESYYLHRTFKTHQRIDKPQPSKIPEEIIRGVFQDHSNSIHPCIGEEGSVEDSSGKLDFKKNIDIGKKSKQILMPELILPFNSPEFLAAWEQWKIYKKTEFKFQYKSVQSENAALSELAGFAKGSDEIAIAIIMQSMAKSWKGLFELKNKSTNGQQTTGGLGKRSGGFGLLNQAIKGS